jgi:hypothetical protein
MSSARALSAARRSYELAHVRAACRALTFAALPVTIAFAIHGVTMQTALLAGALALTIAVFAWSGGAARRGAHAGVVAGLPPLLAPLFVLSLAPSHCSHCSDPDSWSCIAACFGASSFVGIVVAQRARRDVSPRGFASAALLVAALTGLLGCGMTGLGGAIGIGLGVALGSIVGRTLARPGGSPELAD